MTSKKLTLPQRSAWEMQQIREQALVAPGGKYLVDHIFDPPYFFCPISSLEEKFHSRIEGLVTSSWTMPGIPLSHNYWSGDVCNVYLLSEFARDSVLWWEDDYTPNNHQEWFSGPFEDVPTRADLAEYFAAMQDEKPDSELGRALIANQEHAETLLPEVLRIWSRTADQDIRSLIGLVNAICEP